MKKLTIILTDEGEKVFNDLMYSLPKDEDGSGMCTQNEAINYALQRMNFLESTTTAEDIKEVQDYFKRKILSGDFQIEAVDTHVANITIDKVFPFCIWIGNPNTCEPYSEHWPHFIQLPKFSEDEITKCWKLFKPIVACTRAEELKTKKFNEYKRLKTELENEGIINK